MKTPLNFPATIYVVATIACLGIMIIIDYLLGPKAEQLNAWLTVSRLFGNETAIGDRLLFVVLD